MVNNISFRRLFSNSNLSSPLWHAVTGMMGWIGWRDSLTLEEFVGSAHPHPPLSSQRGVRQPNSHQCTIMPSTMSSTLSSSMFTSQTRNIISDLFSDYLMTRIVHLLFCRCCKIATHNALWWLMDLGK